MRRGLSALSLSQGFAVSFRTGSEREVDLMKRTLGSVVLCLAFAGALGACGGDDEGSEDTASGTADGTPAAATNASDAQDKKKRSDGRASRRGVSLKVMNSRYGRMLFDGKGRALYLFTRERTSRSRCYGECARAWPPFLTKGKPRARSDVKGSLLGTTRRRNGEVQVTYRGHPLYYYVDDREPGQVLCQDVVEFGGTWLVVSPSGRAIR
jgi:predicted lipoprotein with Yx(FWY)xxD motif